MASARRFLGRNGNPYARVGADASGRTAIDFGVYGVPETYVVTETARSPTAMSVPSPRARSGTRFCRCSRIESGSETLFADGGDDQIERLEELLPLGRRKARQQLLVGGGGARLRFAQRLGALRRQLDRIGPGVVLGAAALD